MGEGKTDNMYDTEVSGDSRFRSELDSKFDENEMSVIQSLQESYDISHIDLSKLTSEERQAEIKRCKDMNTQYSRIMYFISSNSGYLMYSTNVNYFFISETLKLPTSDYSDFIALQGFAWSIKPLYGWISDSFYPFRYRIKPYIFLTCVLYGLLCAFIALKEPSYSTFCNIWFLMNVCNAFIDAMAEGITAINTKLGSKIAKLQEAERRQTGVIEDEEEENEMKSFGLFNIIRGILRAFMAIIGGLMADKVSIHVSYLILGVYPVIMVLYTLFIFKEEKVRHKLFFCLT